MARLSVKVVAEGVCGCGDHYRVDEARSGRSVRYWLSRGVLAPTALCGVVMDHVGTYRTLADALKAAVL